MSPQTDNKPGAASARPSARLQLLLVMMRQQQQTYGRPANGRLTG